MNADERTARLARVVSRDLTELVRDSMAVGLEDGIAPAHLLRVLATACEIMRERLTTVTAALTAAGTTEDLRFLLGQPVIPPEVAARFTVEQRARYERIREAERHER